MANDPRPAAVITGVSTGIGYATVQELLVHGYQVFGTLRAAAQADQLQAELGPQFTPLLLDVTDAAAIHAAAETVAAALAGRGLAGLVNNAGIAVGGPLMHLDLEDLRRQFEVNVIGALAVTQAFLPLLGARADAPAPPGRIVNISSASGHTIYPFLAPYAASKRALEALSDGLRRELMLYGIEVIVIVPGAVNTPIWDKAEQIDMARYAQTDYAEMAAAMRETAVRLGREGMPASAIAKAIRLALETPKPKTRYVLANNWLMGWVLPRRMPGRMLDRIIAKQLGLDRPPARDEPDEEGEESSDSPA
jgi:NAD(P)-dependent dehydrogenase (short-subunit alcohol dehydrogenase family)